MSLILDAPHVNTKYTPNKAKKASEAKRIEMLGSMNDRRLRARGAGDKQALLELAAEYALIKCPNMANQITIEAENL